ncbi:hypothetical protein G6F68_015215 [Rhizopus microsporus]|nr:hypothetical protein G6F68_015215 [Rhizopus microsporus]
MEEVQDDRYASGLDLQGRHVWPLQQRRVQDRALRDPLAQLAEIPRCIYRHRRHEAAAGIQRHRQQRPAIGLRPQYLASRQRREADELHHGVVLLRPDGAGRYIGRRLAQRRQRGRRALVLRVLPGFQADPAAGRGVRGDRHVARGVDVLCRRAAIFIHQHAALAGYARLARQRIIGL